MTGARPPRFSLAMTRLARCLAVLTLAALAVTSAQAQRADRKTRDFVAANLIAILYHELGHAFIDILKLPIYGQEEDAADVLSVVLINEIFAEQSAQRIAYATAYGFLGEDVSAAAKREVAYWDVHGPDLQRYYTFVCLFYGANPDARRQFARDLKLPDGRARYCDDEYRQAQASWGAVIERLRQEGAGRTIRFLADRRVDHWGKVTREVLQAEVRALNNEMSLPKRLLVRVEPCDTVNAFYDGKTREVIMCTEFAEWLAGVAPR